MAKKPEFTLNISGKTYKSDRPKVKALKALVRFKKEFDGEKFTENPEAIDEFLKLLQIPFPEEEKPTLEEMEEMELDQLFEKLTELSSWISNFTGKKKTESQKADQ